MKKKISRFFHNVSHERNCHTKRLSNSEKVDFLNHKIDKITKCRLIGFFCNNSKFHHLTIGFFFNLKALNKLFITSELWHEICSKKKDKEVRLLKTNLPEQF